MKNIEKKICWFSDKKGSQLFIIVHRATSYIIYTGMTGPKNYAFQMIQMCRKIIYQFCLV